MYESLDFGRATVPICTLTPPCTVRANAEAEANATRLSAIHTLPNASFARFINECWPELRNSKAILRAFYAADADNSGLIGLNEFRMSVAALCARPPLAVLAAWQRTMRVLWRVRSLVGTSRCAMPRWGTVPRGYRLGTRVHTTARRRECGLCTSARFLRAVPAFCAHTSHELRRAVLAARRAPPPTAGYPRNPLPRPPPARALIAFPCVPATTPQGSSSTSSSTPSCGKSLRRLTRPGTAA